MFGKPQEPSQGFGAAPTGSLFGGNQNMFSGVQQPPAFKNEDDDDNGMYKDEEEEEPVQLETVQNPNDPFTKIIEKQVDKFKYMPPKAATKEDKKNCGNGRVSIAKAALHDGQLIMNKIIFRNAIGKALYDGNITK